MKQKIALIACILVSASAFYLFDSSSIEPERGVSSNPTPPLEQGEIWNSRQDQLASLIMNQTKQIVEKNQSSDGKMHRDAHPKAHGCVVANWTLNNSKLPPALRVGVFGDAPGVVPAWIRFSNGAPDGADLPDGDTDVRGMAIKLMTSQGSQDFVLMNSSRFFSRDGEDYFKLFNAINNGTASLGWYMASNPTNLWILLHAKVKIENVLTTTFFSPVPIKLGPTSMRIKALPCADNFQEVVRVDKTHKNFLRELLLGTLQNKSACFDFYVQPNNNPTVNNIENPTLLWNEKESPFIPVARLEIPRLADPKADDFTTPERNNFCENLSFNPWHTRPETRPLGQINRVRKIVYDEVSKFRHAKNHAAEVEPTDHSACEGSAAILCK